MMTILGVAILILVATAPATLLTSAQEKPKPEVFQAQAYGTSTQLGKNFNVTIRIEEYSTAEDQQILLKAFQSAGMEGLSNALSKMSTKGRLAITGTLGYDVSYIRNFRTEDGRKIRLITNRPINFGEQWWDGRSTDYSLSLVELNLSDVKGKSTGTLLPACKFKINKEKEIEVEAFQNPWKLTEILQR
jgi:hypothetical protein